MSQSIAYVSHGGWKEEECKSLWNEIEKTSASGEPLRIAFDRVAEATGRKANSIRNYYYSAVRSGEVPESVPTARALPFVPFTPGEVLSLLRGVLIAQGKGISVRACVQEMSKGDKGLALRLQNKYRSLLRSHRPLVEETVRTLKAENLPCIDPYEKKGDAACAPFPKALSDLILKMSPETRARFLDFSYRLAVFLTQS